MFRVYSASARYSPKHRASRDKLRSHVQSILSVNDRYEIIGMTALILATHFLLSHPHQLVVGIPMLRLSIGQTRDIFPWSFYWSLYSRSVSIGQATVPWSVGAHNCIC